MVEHGVTDYDWHKFLHDLEMALVELAIITIDLCNTMKPETFMLTMCKISKEEKAEGMKKIFEETGWMNKAFLILTSLYVKDKDNFFINSQLIFFLFNYILIFILKTRTKMLSEKIDNMHTI